MRKHEVKFQNSVDIYLSLPHSHVVSVQYNEYLGIHSLALGCIIMDFSYITRQIQEAGNNFTRL